MTRCFPHVGPHTKSVSLRISPSHHTRLNLAHGPLRPITASPFLLPITGRRISSTSTTTPSTYPSAPLPPRQFAPPLHSYNLLDRNDRVEPFTMLPSTRTAAAMALRGARNPPSWLSWIWGCPKGLKWAALDGNADG